MKFVTISPDRFADVLVHLRQTFFVDEPLNKSVQIAGADADHEQLERHCMHTMEEGLSMMAISEEDDKVNISKKRRHKTECEIDIHLLPHNLQIAGVCLNGIVRPGDIEKGLTQLPDTPDGRIFRLLYEENLKLGLFQRYHTAEIFELRIMSVDGAYRGQGVAQQLLMHSQKLAAVAGHTVLKGEATGLFSQKILLSDQFVAVNEVLYASKVNADGTPMFPVQAPHESLKIMIKVLPSAN